LPRQYLLEILLQNATIILGATALLLPILDLAMDLMRRHSVSPDDAGCQQYVIIPRLIASGFQVDWLPFGDVSNFWASHGSGSPVLVLSGHTDVVPSGPADLWKTPPFDPQLIEDEKLRGQGPCPQMLYGRGACDMKGELAALITAAERFVANYPSHKGSLCFLVTSDEETGGANGTKRVVEHLKARGQTIDWCIVGEPSSKDLLGDEIKNGRRGSLSGALTVKGIQGHVAYPQLARNPIHQAAPAITELEQTVWDKGNAYFPATSFQITNVHAGEGAGNVIPAALNMQFNFRYCTEVTEASLRLRVNEILGNHKLDYDLQWVLNGEPFLTPEGELVHAARTAIRQICGLDAQLSTAGGTSDGRFIAPMGVQVVEIGPPNATIHKANECVAVNDLYNLSLIYEEMFKLLLL
jgi:succinyl-diaminopimelate desuccinylase